MGFSRVWVYREPWEKYLVHFAREAAARGVGTVADMALLSRADYEIQWNQYCREYFSGVHETDA